MEGRDVSGRYANHEARRHAAFCCFCLIFIPIIMAFIRALRYSIVYDEVTEGTVLLHYIYSDPYVTYNSRVESCTS